MRFQKVFLKAVVEAKTEEIGNVFSFPLGWDEVWIEGMPFVPRVWHLVEFGCLEGWHEDYIHIYTQPLLSSDSEGTANKNPKNIHHSSSTNVPMIWMVQVIVVIGIHHPFPALGLVRIFCFMWVGAAVKALNKKGHAVTTWILLGSSYSHWWPGCGICSSFGAFLFMVLS